MVKTVSKILITINLIIIAAFLAVSGMLFFATASSKPVIFGFSAVLYKNEPTVPHEDDAAPVLSYNKEKTGTSLLFIKLDEFAPEDRIVFTNSEGNMVVDTIKDISGSIISLKNSDDAILDISPGIIGKVVGESLMWGNMCGYITGHKNVMLLAILGLVVFLVSSFVILLVLALRERKNYEDPFTVPQPLALQPAVKADDSDVLSKPEENADSNAEYFVSKARPVAKRKQEDTPARQPAAKAEAAAVMPNALSKTKLSQDAPLYQPHVARTSPPRNIGVPQSPRPTVKVSTPTQKRADINSIDALRELVEQTSEIYLKHPDPSTKTEARAAHLHANADTPPTPAPKSSRAAEDSFDAIELDRIVTNEKDEIQHIERTYSIIEETAAAKPAISKPVASMPTAEPAPKPTPPSDEPKKADSSTLFSVDSLLDDIIGQAASDYYKAHKDEL